MKFEIRQTLPSKWVISHFGYLRSFIVRIYADGAVWGGAVVSTNEHISGEEAEKIVGELYCGDWLVKADEYVDHVPIANPLFSTRGDTV